MNEKLDKLVDRIVGGFDKWLEEFEKNPIRTAVKVVIILWLVKQARHFFYEAVNHTQFRR